ncbi:hypothetical protein DH2020_022837 [Rehmannia glutinosa]|uniref:HTH TFE/IIEalpha-type domain-containing protein n=1 Tax=Rehmannia glutinosa TaxID=99300 RepID=A0ABR0W8T2_REHGL
MASIEPFNRLVKLAARAFYDDITTKSENQTKAGRSDNRGIAVVILDALTRRQWVREEDLAKDLKLHTKQLRRILRFFEEEKLVTRDHRKETSKGAKIYNAAVAATVDGKKNGREGDDKLKMHTQSYCCLDYAQIYDVVRYRLQRMKKKLKDELESKNTVQEYICPNCSKSDEYFHCESCNGVLVAESDKLAGQELGDGDDNASRRRHDKLKDMLTKMEDLNSLKLGKLGDKSTIGFSVHNVVIARPLGCQYVLSLIIEACLVLAFVLGNFCEQIKPLMDQLGRVKDLPAPEFGNLQAWELRANAAGRAANGDSANDPSQSLHGLGFGGTPMPYVGETKVEVAFSGADENEDVKSANTNTPMKVLPPWMIKEGMNLTKEQRGETRPAAKMGGTATASELPDDKKSATVNEDTKNVTDEYIKAYYAAVLVRQREQEETVKKEEESPNTGIPNEVYNTPSERQVGMKSKRDADDEGDDEEWEEGPPAEMMKRGGGTAYDREREFQFERREGYAKKTLHPFSMLFCNGMSIGDWGALAEGSYSLKRASSFEAWSSEELGAKYEVIVRRQPVMGPYAAGPLGKYPFFFFFVDPEYPHT